MGIVRTQATIGLIMVIGSIFFNSCKGDRLQKPDAPERRAPEIKYHIEDMRREAANEYYPTIFSPNSRYYVREA